MRKLLLLVTCAYCAQASTFTIVSGTASSGFGVNGVGAYASDVSILYSLEQYDRADIALPDLKQDSYLRYSYVFAAGQPSVTRTADHAFERLILSLGEGCASDSECIFGIGAEGTSPRIGDIRTYSGEPGLSNPIHGILLDEFLPPVQILAVSFFSNRIPDPEGRIYLRGGDDYLLTDAGAVITPKQHVLPQTEPLATPEPVTFSLFASGLTGIVLLRRSRG